MMMMRSKTALLLPLITAAALVAAPAPSSAQTAGSPANADSATDLDRGECNEEFTYVNALMRAENAYVKRRYATVIEILAPIRAFAHCIDDPNAAIEIDLLLGVSYFEQKNKAVAETFFLNVLRADPEHVVGSIITLPESSARRIEQLRAEHAEELNKLRAKLSPNTVIESLYVLVEKEKHPYWINFLPLGAGMFQMHENSWGAIYAASQAVGLGLTIAGSAMVEYYRGDNFTFTAQNRARAKNWQNAQIVGIALFCASYVGSVVHALVVHEPETLIIHSPSQTRPDLAAAYPVPFVMPDGGGFIYTAAF